MLDFPATALALWSLYDRGGPRPEYVLPVLWFESNFQPGIVNSIGCVGINQACPFAMSIPDGYETWSASQQLAGLVSPMYLAIVSKYGPLRSGTRAYQANFLPATLATATSLSSVLATQGDAVYAANSGFDYTHKGTIAVSDLAHAISVSAVNPAVQSAISQTYAQRPSESPSDPVYGTDFLLPRAAAALKSAALPAVALGGAAFLGRAQLARAMRAGLAWLRG